MPLELSILYRGDLSSCNYDCPYCPFAKHFESPEELQNDRAGLARFVEWAATRSTDRLSFFFTPWGEALARSWYRHAITELSRFPQVQKVAVQTNLSCDLNWLKDTCREKLGFWCTYHPGQVDRAAFLAKCAQLSQLGVRHSVGCVGLREHLAEIAVLRRELPAETYLWINAYKSAPAYYDEALLEALEQIDPLFPINNTRHPSQGRACRTGHQVITVDGRGDIRRCHFVEQVIGNLYEPHFENALIPRACPNASCGCHIGYVHLEHLKLDTVFGDGVFERVPIKTFTAASIAKHSRPSTSTATRSMK